MIPKLDIQNILTFSLDSRKQRTQPVTTSPKQKPFDQTRFTTLEKKWETRLEPTTYKKFLPRRGSNPRPTKNSYLDEARTHLQKILTSTRLEPHIHTSNKLEVPPQAYSTHIMLIIILRKAWISHTAPPRNYDSSCLPC